MAPRDPILGITEAFNADQNPAKVNLGVGVYYDENGKIPLLECVRRAEQQLVQTPRPRGYLPIDGMPVYDQAVRTLVFGADHPAITEKRVVTVQTLGGTGGLKVGADFLRRVAPSAGLWISDPSWENHRALFENAGFTVATYPYYDAATKGLRFEAMLEGLGAIPSGDVVVLHACCHNPTGVDLSSAQWQAVAEVVKTRGLVPFLDMAYQGFAEGIDADAAAVRAFASTLDPVFVSSSFSKSFSLYGERVGALSIVAGSADEAARALSQLKRLVRTNYSNPPTHGGQVVATVLNDPELRRLWDEELAGMRDRIRRMREKLTALLAAKRPGVDYGFMTRQRGMFSYSGLTKEQVTALRERFAIYAVDSGRICVAALNERNIAAVADAMAAV
ncbi:MAG: aspartate/tyrosine/aromatic aminotransferase [Deltaproteobacteria bacterium]|nr:aspartate/tyrosine/aromatic aminotransferase [Deltaproteobacteria bacterium]